MRRVNINLTEDQYSTLREVAHQTNRSMAEMVRDAVAGFVDVTDALNGNPTNINKGVERAMALKGIKLCKHGYAVGLCKKGCTK